MLMNVPYNNFVDNKYNKYKPVRKGDKVGKNTINMPCGFWKINFSSEGADFKLKYMNRLLCT